MKGLKTEKLKDHMSEAELIFTALAELSTRQIAETMDAVGMDENKVVGKKGYYRRELPSAGIKKGVATIQEKNVTSNISPQTSYLRIDERNHVEKPLLDQLAGLDWEIIDLDAKQHPTDSHRQSFTEVVMLPVLRKHLKIINPWLEDDQIEEVIKPLTASFPGSGLISNNRHAFTLLLENISVSENRQTGERSPTLRFVDFNHQDNNRFIAVCQFKMRILGTEHHIIPDIVLFLNGLPVVVIECKSPRVKDAIPEAIDQMLRYSEQSGAKGEGSALLFFYNQIVIATCRKEAKFGTITTHSEKHFYRWADPYPRTVDELEHGASGPNDQ